MTRLFPCLLLLITVFAATVHSAEPEVVPLWDGVPPGSEGQTGEEIVRLSDGGERIVSNVHRPSLTVYPAQGGTATTALAPAVLIVPGGGHRERHAQQTRGGRGPHRAEPVDRLLGQPLAERHPAQRVEDPRELRLPRQEGSPYTIEHEVADGKRAIRVLRQRAAEWRIDPARIGMISFSAGGELTARVAVAADDGDPDAADPVERQGTRLAFQALMYPAHPEVIQPAAGAPTAFLCWGFTDFPMIADGMGGVYARFRAARVPVEMHVYFNAGHGFGIRANDTSPAGKWIDRFYEWFGSLGLLNADGSR